MTVCRRVTKNIKKRKTKYTLKNKFKRIKKTKKNQKGGGGKGGKPVKLSPIIHHKGANRSGNHGHMIPSKRSVWSSSSVVPVISNTGKPQRAKSETESLIEESTPEKPQRAKSAPESLQGMVRKAALPQINRKSDEEKLSEKLSEKETKTAGKKQNRAENKRLKKIILNIFKTIEFNPSRDNMTVMAPLRVKMILHEILTESGVNIKHIEKTLLKLKGKTPTLKNVLQKVYDKTNQTLIKDSIVALNKRIVLRHTPIRSLSLGLSSNED